MADLRVLIAPQEFKGTLPAVAAAEAIATGLRRSYPGWTFDLLPMADGGPGTTDALLTALGGQRHAASASDPRRRPIEASWGLLTGKRAIVECAAASGLLRLSPDELTPEAVRHASSYGTGELILAALGRDIDEVIVGLGGSATNDGGAGMAQALGFRLFDSRAADLATGGVALRDLDRIDVQAAHPALKRIRFVGATDVTNPLCGSQGASAVYGPQKGADASAIEELDAALAHFASVIKRDLGVEVADRPGAGAAGGLGAGLIAFLGADLIRGAQVVAQAADLEGRMRLADLVITGEGRLDAQTAFGKTPQYVAEVAVEAGRPVVCLAGHLGEGYETAIELFNEIEALSDGKGPLPSPDEAGEQIGRALERAVGRLLGRGVLTQPR